MFTTTTMFQGNLTADPKLRYTTNGTPIAEFRVLVSHRIKDRDNANSDGSERWIDGEPTGHNVKVIGRLAEEAFDQLHKGQNVIVIGRTETDAWPEPTTGEKRTSTRVIVDRNGTLGIGLTTSRRQPPITDNGTTSEYGRDDSDSDTGSHSGE